MTTRIWIKLYIEMLEDPQVGRLSDHLWRRLMELSMLAGRVGNDGALLPLEEMAWKLRVPEGELLEDLHALAGAGMLHIEPGESGSAPLEPRSGTWIVTGFEQQQSPIPVDERMRRYRERKKEVTERNKDGYAAAGVDSTSTSSSDSDSASAEPEEGVPGGKPCRGGFEPPSAVSATRVADANSSPVPSSPAEALLHPDLRLFAAATGGRIPGLGQYRAVIETMGLIRTRKPLDDPGLRRYLAPFWQAWSGRKRKDGLPYDPGNISWLTDWALNGSIPPAAQSARGGGKKGKAVEDKLKQFLNKNPE